MFSKMKNQLMATLGYVVLSSMTIILAGGCHAAEMKAPDAVIGKTAPAFTLVDSNGKKQNLSDYKGKFVVLEWVNYECPFVRKHYDSSNMQKLQKNYTDKGVVWLSINSSAPGKQGNYTSEQINQLLKEKKAAPSHYLLDTEGLVGRAYGAKTTPHMFVIDPNGVLIYAGAIDDTPGTEVSEIDKARNYVKVVLDEAMAGKAPSISKTTSYGCSVKYQ